MPQLRPQLVVPVTAPARPGLRTEVAPGRRLLVRQQDRIVLFGRQRQRHQGVHYARTGQYRSPLPMLTAAQARETRSWPHRFADYLRTAADGPLHSGDWTLSEGMPSWTVPTLWPKLAAHDPDRGHVTWYGYGDPPEDTRDVIPLRRLSPPDAARVRSYRRQLREGVLPPILLWESSGFQTLLVLDGHDRIAAAIAEDTVPEVIVLAPGPDPEVTTLVQEPILRAFDGRMRHLEAHRDPFAADRIAAANRQLATDLRAAEDSTGRTRAWLLPGGAAEWDHQAATLVPGWPPPDQL